ncbi:unnamed protein product, partial [marine sediment metagenome]
TFTDQTVVVNDGVYVSTDFGVWLDVVTGNVSYCRTDSEAPINAIYYRGNGVPLANSTISWPAVEQLIQAGQADHTWIEPVITVASNGFPFIAMTDRDESGQEPDYHVYYIMSDSGNGTWNTPVNGWPSDYCDEDGHTSRFISLTPLNDGNISEIHAEYEGHGVLSAWGLYANRISGGTGAIICGKGNVQEGGPGMFGLNYAQVAVGNDTHVVYCEGNVTSLWDTYHDYTGNCTVWEGNLTRLINNDPVLCTMGWCSQSANQLVASFMRLHLDLLDGNVPDSWAELFG